MTNMYIVFYPHVSTDFALAILQNGTTKFEMRGKAQMTLMIVLVTIAVIVAMNVIFRTMRKRLEMRLNGPNQG